MAADTPNRKLIKVSVDLDVNLIMHLDALRTEWGYKKRGEILSHLLREIFVINKQRGT